MKTLVLITGTGRSGTSTISGSLHHLGLFVPGPYLGANDSNPKGFYESRWAVKFHKEVTDAAHIHDFDSRPAAFERVQEAITPDLRRQLGEFLIEHAADHDQVVVKDPRSVWAQSLWREAAAEAGLDIRYISMLRHPAEVVGSRSANYADQTDQAKRRRYETFNVARWVNSSVISERETRGHIRAFVSYPDLLTDWRPVLARLGQDLGLRYDVDVTSTGPNAVDEFIDPSLRRHMVTWDELQVPVELQDVAQRIWDDLLLLADGHGVDKAASADLDVQSERYSRLLAEAADISHDAAEEVRENAHRAGAREARIQQAKKAAQPQAPASIDELPVGQVGGRDLLKVIAQRAKRKLRR